MKRVTHATAVRIAAAVSILLIAGTAQGASPSLKKHVSVISSTVPTNGDVNPYGIVQVPKSAGKLHEGNLLISNFNNAANLQGTGTTIVQVSPGGSLSLFAQIDPSALPGPCPGGIGLTTALAVLRTGWVIVGSLPTSDGSSATAKAGCLLVLNSDGKVVETIANYLINGPWDMTSVDDDDHALLFVTNVLNDTLEDSPNVAHHGTVVRILLDTSRHRTPKVISSTVIGSGFPERTDPDALVIGPTGVAFDLNHDVLYVADSLTNRIAVIHDAAKRNTSAGVGSTLTTGGWLNDPLGLALASNGNILAANGDDGRIVEITPRGKQVASRLVDNTGGPPPGAGTLFGLVATKDGEVYFVDDGSNTLNLLH